MEERPAMPTGHLITLTHRTVMNSERVLWYTCTAGEEAAWQQAEQIYASCNTIRQGASARPAAQAGACISGRRRVLCWSLGQHTANTTADQDGSVVPAQRAAKPLTAAWTCFSSKSQSASMCQQWNKVDPKSCSAFSTTGTYLLSCNGFRLNKVCSVFSISDF